MHVASSSCNNVRTRSVAASDTRWWWYDLPAAVDDPPLPLPLTKRGGHDEVVGEEEEYGGVVVCEVGSIFELRRLLRRLDLGGCSGPSGDDPR